MMKATTYNQTSRGFTIVEAVVTIAVVSIFLGLLFQTYLAAEAQRLSVAKRAAANDITVSNLNKITSKAQLPATGNGACDDTTSGSGNLTNRVRNADAPGVDLFNSGGGSAGFQPENGDTVKILGGDAAQKLIVLYPRGCGTAPARIQSTVTYGTNNPKETITHVSYVN